MAPRPSKRALTDFTLDMARLLTLLIAAAAVASLVTASPVARDNRSNAHWAGKARYLYLATNVKPNAIRAIPVNEDGSISEQGSTTLTGGDGGNEIDSATNTPHAPDALGSQGSVQLADNVSRSFKSSDNIWASS